jgi:hypothetical protein
MKRLPPLWAAVLVVLLGVAGCSSTAAAPVSGASERPAAEVTGFSSAGGMFESGSTGPVTVRVSGTSATRLVQQIDQLPHSGYVHCEEPLGLVYRIVLITNAGARDKTVVDGYRCDAAVTVKADGQAISWRRDATCGLIATVRKLLPGRAKATQDLTIGCNS